MPVRFNLELPPGTSGPEDLKQAINSSMRLIQGALEGPVKLYEDMDASGMRITRLGDPQAGTDALNRNAADRRYTAGPAGTPGGGGGGTTTTIVQAGGGGRLILLSVPGILSIRSSAAPLVALAENRTSSQVEAMVKQAPAGADVRLVVRAAGAAWAQVTLAAGQTRAVVAQAAAIAAGAVIEVDVTAVGSVFPGADLTLMIALA